MQTLTFQEEQKSTKSVSHMADSFDAARILYVDDEPDALESFKRNLNKKFQITTCSSGKEGLSLINEKEPFAVIIADMQMPGMDGIKFLQEVSQKSPLSVRLMLTGNADQSTAVEAVNYGHVYTFLNKPCDLILLEGAIKSAIKHHKLMLAEHNLLEYTLHGSVQMLTEMLAYSNPKLFYRGQRLKEYATTFCRELKIEPMWPITIAAMFSQIGYLTLPQNICNRLQTSRCLNAHESKLLEEIPQITSELIKKIPRLEPVAEIILTQNHHFSNTQDTANIHIPLGARILKILSDIIELEGAGRSKSQALEFMDSRQGWYDPELLEKAHDWAKRNDSNHPVQEVSIDELKVGHHLASDIKDVNEQIVFHQGSILTPTSLYKIEQLKAASAIKGSIQIFLI